MKEAVMNDKNGWKTENGTDLKYFLKKSIAQSIQSHRVYSCFNHKKDD